MMTHHVWLTEEDYIHHGYPTDKYITWMLLENGSILIRKIRQDDDIYYGPDINILGDWFFMSALDSLDRAKKEGADWAIVKLQNRMRSIESEISVLEMKGDV